MITSALAPREDFEFNAASWFNVLDAIRRESPVSLFLYASTNQIYSRMENLGEVEHETYDEYRDLASGVEGQSWVEADRNLFS